MSTKQHLHNMILIGLVGLFVLLVAITLWQVRDVASSPARDLSTVPPAQDDPFPLPNEDELRLLQANESLR